VSIFLFPSPCLDFARTIRSTYSSALTTDTTERYSRDQHQSSNYFYQALQLKIATNGLFQFRGDSAIHLYGYLYESRFNPLDPTHNLLSENDDESGKDGLWLNASLSSNVSNILVVTTRSPDRTGLFMIQAFGPAEVTFNLIRE
jgi:hypothetical protein